jgi:hypothetical protein
MLVQNGPVSDGLFVPCPEVRVSTFRTSGYCRTPFSDGSTALSGNLCSSTSFDRPGAGEGLRVAGTGAFSLLNSSHSGGKYWHAQPFSFSEQKGSELAARPPRLILVLISCQTTKCLVARDSLMPA